MTPTALITGASAGIGRATAAVGLTRRGRGDIAVLGLSVGINIYRV